MDPNKYAKNAKIDPNSKVSTIMSIVSFILMLIGLIKFTIRASKTIFLELSYHGIVRGVNHA